MEFMKFIDIENEEWNLYLEQLDGCTFNYTAEKINFDVEYAINIVSNESVLCLVDKKIVGAAVFYIEKNNEDGYTVSWSNSYCPIPIVGSTLEYRKQEKYIEEILKYIGSVAKNYGCVSIKLRYDPLSNPDSRNKICNYNFLLKEGYIDNSSLTQIIDLQKEEVILWTEVRKTYRRYINKGDYKIRYYDHENITEDVIEEYKRIYELDAGKVTRNSEMYYHYYRFVKSGNGLVAIAEKNGETVAVLVITIYKDTSYYSSYGELEEKLEGVPVGHFLHWNTILELKRRGIKFHEMGEQVFGPTHYNNPEQKLINISNFKRGFGGYTLPIFRGIKYLNTDKQ